MRIAEAVDKVIDVHLDGRRHSIREFVEIFGEEYPALLAEEGERLARRGLARVFHDQLRKRTDIDPIADQPQAGEQLALPGLKPPGSFAVKRDDGDIGYVGFWDARWPDWEDAVALRNEGIAADIARRDDLIVKQGFLRPVMAEWPDRTTREALLLLLPHE